MKQKFVTLLKDVTRIGNREKTPMAVKNTLWMNIARKMAIIMDPNGPQDGAPWKIGQMNKEELLLFVPNAVANPQVNFNQTN